MAIQYSEDDNTGPVIIKSKLFYEGHPRRDFYRNLVKEAVEIAMKRHEGLKVRYSPKGPEIGEVIGIREEENGIDMQIKIFDSRHLPFFGNGFTVGYGEGEHDEDGFIKEFKLTDLFIGPCTPVKKIWKVKEVNNGK